MKLIKKDYDILAEVSSLVESQLEVMEALGEARKFRIDARSRLICRCPSCQAEADASIDWVGRMRQQPGPQVGAPVVEAPKRRMFGER